MSEVNPTPQRCRRPMTLAEPKLVSSIALRPKPGVGYLVADGG
jgi:hypothetical protein